jgi:hypothetical protein
MLDVAVTYNRYKFIGHEFLTWLWFCMETEPERLTQIQPDTTLLSIGNRIVLENRSGQRLETITIRGDDAGLEEGVLALAKGAVVTELHLCYKSKNHEWQFSIKGESLSLSNLKLPQTGQVENPADIEGAVLEKAYLFDQVLKLVEALYDRFIHLRVSLDWSDSVLPAMKAWIHSRRN